MSDFDFADSLGDTTMDDVSDEDLGLDALDEGWSDSIVRTQFREMFKSPSDAFLSLWAVVGMLGLISVVHTYRGAKMAWQFVDPFSDFYEERRQRIRKAEELKRMIAKREVKTKAPPAQQLSAAEDTNLFFGRLPAEIRLIIQEMAFGDKTLHMDLDFNRPMNLLEESRLSKAAKGVKLGQARVYKKAHGADAHAEHVEEGHWQWGGGCNCNQHSSENSLTHRRARNFAPQDDSDSDNEKCMVHKHKGAANNNQIGIMGWLLTCKQAYLEGTQILYGANTLHIASSVLHRGIQDIIPPRQLSQITSLELVWNPRELPLDQGFIGHFDHSAPPSYIFPQLKHLRISFRRLANFEKDHATGLVWPYDDPRVLAKKLNEYTFPTMDKLLERMVPPTTEVTISCPKWEWYEAIDMALMEKQGAEITRPQRSGDEGLKVWRQSISAPDSHSGYAAPRRGSWVHVAGEDMQLDQYGLYDWERHNMHNLGPQQYEYRSNLPPVACG